ncbi:EGF-like domain protein, partial [Teladorsagia circumcincta]
LCDDATQLCGSLEAQTSCGQCIKQHPECAWCRDPHSTEQKRCQVRSAFKTETCNPTYVYSPVTEIRIGPHNMPLGSPGSGKSIVQLEPQQVVLRMKPGDTLIVPYKYLHRKPPAGYDVKDFLVQTSEYKKLGINLQFFVDCNGYVFEVRVSSERSRVESKGGTDTFRIRTRTVWLVHLNGLQVTLMDCRDGADVAISVGVYGYTTVSALYITPLCGRRIHHCATNMAISSAVNVFAKRLEVVIGVNISGRFCQCDHLSCPTGADGRQCSGNGVCECGTCRCEEGWEREDCSCSTDKGTCMEGGTECSGNGHCECGKCVCDEGFNGATCGIADEVATAAPTEPEEAIEEEPTEPSE